MRAGELRHRVTIQEPQAGRDSYGAETVVWVNVATVWAAIEPLAGQERFLAQSDQVLAEGMVRIRIRYRSGITAKMRVAFSNRVFDVQQIAEVQTRRREMLLICREKNL